LLFWLAIYPEALRKYHTGTRMPSFVAAPQHYMSER
jgi:hypothetical protein